MFGRFKLTGANLEIFRFAFYVSFPIGVMLYVGSDTHRKLNIENFWPDPNRLNYPPKDPVEIKAELERMRQERLLKRQRLEEKARALEASSSEQVDS
ncbi:protein Pet100p, mitochondrial [Trichomonascus vanleenenianus]|uniref:Pet100p n=1 Tax=Trichomonascus vanleenenianus TaxID=2268995 RepID=UPI003EC987A6